MKNRTLSEFRSKLLTRISNNPDTAILTHVNPDGDGFAAALALQEILQAKGISAEIILESEISELYNYIDGRLRSTLFTSTLSYDLLIILDCHETKRLGVCADLIKSTDQDIFILDHHQEDKVIKTTNKIIDPSYVSVGAMIYDIFKVDIIKLKDKSKAYVAEAIYTTLLNDTDNFINANVDRKTFEIAADLMDLGLFPGEIAEKFLLVKSIAKLKLIGEVLSSIDVRLDGKILFMESTEEMLKSKGLDESATDKMTGLIKGTKGVEVIVFLREGSDADFKISLRSNVINVNSIARKFGGGGHIKASGCTIKGSSIDVKNKIFKEIIAQYK